MIYVATLSSYNQDILVKTLMLGLERKKKCIMPVCVRQLIISMIGKPLKSAIEMHKNTKLNSSIKEAS